MTNNRRDVNLVVKARDESVKLFEGLRENLAGVLGLNDDLAASSGKAGNRLEQLAAAALTFDKAATKIFGTADSAAAAFDRMGASIVARKAELAALQAQMESSGRARAQLQGKIVDTVLAGGDQSGLIAQLKLVEKEYDRLVAASAKLAGGIATAESGLNGQRTSLQQVGSTAIAAEQAHAELTAAIELENLALRENASLSRSAAAAQSFFNAKFAPGLSRGGGDAAGSAAFFTSSVVQEDLAHKELIRTLKAEEAQEAELARTKEARARAALLLPGASFTGKSASASAGVFQAAEEARWRRLGDAIGVAARETAAMETAAENLREELNPSAAIVARLHRELAQAERLFKSGRITAIEYAQAQELLRANAKRAADQLGRVGRGEGGRPSLFGLKPYELTNLGYQVNDIFTQLASGTSLTQTLAQQGGQLIQLFPRLGSGIVAAFTSAPILAATAAVGSFVLGLREAGKQAETLRNIQGALAANADGPRYQAEALSEATRELDHFGMTAEEATKLVRLFLKEGVDPGRITDFGMAAKNMADVMGVDVPTAAAQMVDGFNGGFQSIRKLDEATNFLTASEAEHIRSLMEQGQQVEANAEAFRLFSNRMEEGADNMRGPWSEAARSLGNAWADMWAQVTDSKPVKIAAAGLNLVATLAAEAMRTKSDLEQANALGEQLQARISQARRDGNVAEVMGSSDFKEMLTKYDEIQKRIEARAAKARAEETEAQIKRDADFEREMQKKAVANKEVGEAQRLQLVYSEALAEANENRVSQTLAIAAAERAVAREKKKISEENKREADRLKRERDAAEREQERKAKDPVHQSMTLLKDFEGFRSRAYWDVNAYRVGYGSDTTTRADGSIQRVDRNTTTNEADAVRDLERRIGEFQNVIKTQIGSERFGTFSPQQQAALTSIAYNYGSLPERILSAVRMGTTDEIAAAVRGLAGDNGGVNAKRRNREADMLGTPNLAVEANAEKQWEDFAKKQDDFNAAIDAENTKRGQTIALTRELAGLEGEQLIDAQRRQFVEEAVNAQRAKAAKDNLAYTAEQEATTRALAFQEFEITRGIKERTAARKEDLEKQREAVDQMVSDLTDQRQELQSQIEFLRESGQGGLADGLLPQLDGINARLVAAIEKAREFYSALAVNPEALKSLGLTAEQIEAIVLKLDTAKLSTQQLGEFMGVSLGQIAQTATDGLVEAFDRFAQSVAEGRNVFSSVWQAFRAFAADFLRQIARMIMQQIIMNAVTAVARALGAPSVGGGGGGKGSADGIKSFKFHRGGIVGAGGERMNASPAWFQNAMRYHTGGIAGLKPDEVPAVLRRGEEVLTAADPRHRANGGGKSGDVHVKNVTVLNPADLLTHAVADRAGEKVLLNFVSENAGAFRQAMGL